MCVWFCNYSFSWNIFVNNFQFCANKKVPKKQICSNIQRAGLNPVNIKILRILTRSQISDKILKFLKISSDFQNVFLSKYSEENFLKSLQPAAPKYFVWKFLRLSEKISGFKSLRFLLIGLCPGFSLFYIFGRQVLVSVFH